MAVWPSRNAASAAQRRLQLEDESLDEKAEKVDSKFDWVDKRSACSLPKVFKALRLEVEEDVKARNAMRPENSPYEFSVVEDLSDFSVVLKAKDLHRTVTFKFEEHAIIILDPSGNQMFEVTLNFTDEGKCRMKAKEENRESWQVRRMALEDLMFRTI
jgi:hypothetical protein